MTGLANDDGRFIVKLPTGGEPEWMSLVRYPLWPYAVPRLVCPGEPKRASVERHRNCIITSRRVVNWPWLCEIDFVTANDGLTLANSNTNSSSISGWPSRNVHRMTVDRRLLLSICFPVLRAHPLHSQFQPGHHYNPLNQSIVAVTTLQYSLVLCPHIDLDRQRQRARWRR